MYKKNLLHLMAIMMVAMLSSGFVACDKVDEFSGSVNASDVVGNWKCKEGTNSWGESMSGKYLMIESNGTYSSNSSSLYAGYYTLSANKMTLRSNSGKTFTAKVAVNKTKKTLVLKGETKDGGTFNYSFKQ